MDFGASAAFGAHLFQVEIPAALNRSIISFENYGYSGATNGIPSGEERVELKRTTWSAIADIARRDYPQGAPLRN